MNEVAGVWSDVCHSSADAVSALYGRPAPYLCHSVTMIGQAERKTNRRLHKRPQVRYGYHLARLESSNCLSSAPRHEPYSSHLSSSRHRRTHNPSWHYVRQSLFAAYIFMGCGTRSPAFICTSIRQDCNERQTTTWSLRHSVLRKSLSGPEGGMAYLHRMETEVWYVLEDKPLVASCVPDQSSFQDLSSISVWRANL